jgi:hypothetical protein
MALDFEATVSLGLGKLDAINDGIKALREDEAIHKSLGVSNTPSALTTQTLVIPQRPAAGKMWFVRRVVILGADGHTSVANAVADIYGGPAGNQTADPTSQIYAGLTLPTIIVEGRFHNPVVFGETVYALLYNLPAQQVVQFAIAVDEYQVKSVMAMGT